MICLYLPRCWSTTINNGYRRKWIRETTFVCFVWLVPQLLPLLCKTPASAQKRTAQRFVGLVLPARSQVYSVCCKLAFLALPVFDETKLLLWSQKVKKRDELAASFSRRLASCACCLYDNKYLSAFLRVTPPILRCTAWDARERGII